jgi:fructose-bisphosphate aldolase/6-deoxy-5-ketofructose 1-phosphate synthase
LKTLYEQIHVGGCRGNATGRNVHQRSLVDAVKLCNAIAAITYDDATVEQALKLV